VAGGLGAFALVQINRSWVSEVQATVGTFHSFSQTPGSLGGAEKLDPFRWATRPKTACSKSGIRNRSHQTALPSATQKQRRF
jgi:hypothetical protein